MIKILFCCHGTTSISWDFPRGATINHVTHPNYYNFTTLLSPDMNLLQQKTVLKEANIAFFRTVFCLSAIFSKTCFAADKHFFALCVREKSYSRTCHDCRNCFRYFAGVISYFFLKSRMNWVVSEYPMESQISSSFISVVCRSFCARSSLKFRRISEKDCWKLSRNSLHRYGSL